MKRVLFGFWISLGVLLLGGYSQLYALTPASGIFSTIQNEQLAHINLGIPTEKGAHTIEAPVIEEDDQFNTFKKYLQSRCQFAALFLAQALKDLLHESVQGSPFTETYAHVLSERSHVLLRVFRI